MHQRRLGTLLTDEPRREVEVVIVKEDRRVRRSLQLRDDGRGEARVDFGVAICPGEVERAVEIGRVRKIPEAVVNEPQHRVRDDVVKQPVRVLLVSDQAKSIGCAVPAGLVDRARGDAAILLGDRARDPRHVVMGHEGAKRRDESAAAAARCPGTVRTARIGHRPPVRDDDQLSARRRRVRPRRQPELPPRRCRCRATDSSARASHAEAAA